MFTQYININGMNMAHGKEFMKICKEHPKCKDCPLKDNEVQLQGGLTRCETGRMKGDSRQ